MANALDVALRDTVATKHDIEQLRLELKADIAEIRSGLEANTKLIFALLIPMLLMIIGLFFK